MQTCCDSQDKTEKTISLEDVKNAFKTIRDAHDSGTMKTILNEGLLGSGYLLLLDPSIIEGPSASDSTFILTLAGLESSVEGVFARALTSCMPSFFAVCLAVMMSDALEYRKQTDGITVKSN